MFKTIWLVAGLVLSGGLGAQTGSDDAKMGIPRMTVPNAPRVTKLVRGGTASDLQNGAVLQLGDKIDNISGADVDIIVENLGMIRVKPHSAITITATKKPNAKLIVTLDRGRAMCWVKFNPTQYAFIARSGPVMVQAASGQGTSFLIQTNRQPRKQPNFVTVLCGNGGVKVTMDDPGSGAFVLDGQMIKVDPRNPVGQAGKPHDFEKRDLRELRNGPY